MYTFPLYQRSGYFRRFSTALRNDTTVSLIAHLTVLRHSKARTALVLLHQQLGVAEIATERSAFAAIAVFFRHLQIQGLIHLVLEMLRGRGWGWGWGGIDPHFRFHMHRGGLIVWTCGQTVSVLPEMLFCVTQKRTEHIRRAPDTHRTHGIRSTLCNCILLFIKSYEFRTTERHTTIDNDCVKWD